MRVITFNANGLRSAARKGFFNWLARQNADVLCVQELKAQPEQIAGTPFVPRGWYRHLACAEKKGYSGVALYTRREPLEVTVGCGDPEFDAEGRYVEAVLDDVIVVSAYFPSGTTGDIRQAAKYRFLDRFLRHMDDLKERGLPVILCGDVNIAHRNIDLRNWRSNQKNSGFLPEERAWMDQLLDQRGWVDAFREVNQEPDQYTWWSNRGRAWDKNVGWRIDYQLITPDLSGRVLGASIYKRNRYSDHAPLTIEYDLG